MTGDLELVFLHPAGWPGKDVRSVSVRRILTSYDGNHIWVEDYNYSSAPILFR